MDYRILVCQLLLKEIIFNETNNKVEAFETVELAVKEALKEDNTDLVLIFGSFFTVSEAYKSLSKFKSKISAFIFHIP